MIAILQIVEIQLQCLSHWSVSMHHLLEDINALLSTTFVLLRKKQVIRERSGVHDARNVIGLVNMRRIGFRTLILFFAFFVSLFCVGVC